MQLEVDHTVLETTVGIIKTLKEFKINVELVKVCISLQLFI